MTDGQSVDHGDVDGGFDERRIVDGGAESASVIGVGVVEFVNVGGEGSLVGKRSRAVPSGVGTQAADRHNILNAGRAGEAAGIGWSGC